MSDGEWRGFCLIVLLWLLWLWATPFVYELVKGKDYWDADDPEIQAVRFFSWIFPPLGVFVALVATLRDTPGAAAQRVRTAFLKTEERDEDSLMRASKKPGGKR